MLECMKNRRSIRKYTDQDIPESLLNELLKWLLVPRIQEICNCIVSWLPATLRTRRNWLRLILTNQ